MLDQSLIKIQKLFIQSLLVLGITIVAPHIVLAQVIQHEDNYQLRVLNKQLTNPYITQMNFFKTYKERFGEHPTAEELLLLNVHIGHALNGLDSLSNVMTAAEFIKNPDDQIVADAAVWTEASKVQLCEKYAAELAEKTSASTKNNALIDNMHNIVALLKQLDEFLQSIKAKTESAHNTWINPSPPFDNALPFPEDAHGG